MSPLRIFAIFCCFLQLDSREDSFEGTGVELVECRGGSNSIFTNWVVLSLSLSLSLSSSSIPTIAFSGILE